MSSTDKLTIRRLIPAYAKIISAALSEMGWDRSPQEYEKYYMEQESGDRWVLVACYKGDFAGYLTIV